MMRVMGWNGSPEPRDSGTRRLASRRGSGVADFHKMTLRLQAGHVQGMNAGYFEAGRHLPELVLFDLTFERQPNATCGERVTAPGEHVSEAGKGTRGDAIVSTFQFFNTYLLDARIRQRQGARGFAQEARLLAIAVHQCHL